MGLAWKEIKYFKKKYIMIEILLILMIFMVLFLSGLANGLGRAVSSSIESDGATSYIINDESQDIITISFLDQEILEKVQKSTENKAAPLNIKRANINEKGDNEKTDIVYFAIDSSSFLNPEVNDGAQISSGKNEIVLDDAFKEEGYKVGNTIEDTSSGLTMKIIGFTNGKMYGHVPVGYITTDTYKKIEKEMNPIYILKYNAILLNGSDIDDIKIDGIKVEDKDTIVDNLPGYAVEQTTILMMLWVLLVVSAAILGVFFYIITLQKRKQYGVLKAIGMSMSEIGRSIIAQISLLSFFGVLIGNAIVFAMSKVLPSSMSFYIKPTDAVMISVIFILISVLSGLISVKKVSKVDPIITIGGGE